MKIKILTIGSRGDVQPYIALGIGLKNSGHDVSIVTHGEFEKLIINSGLGFSSLTVNPRKMLEDEAPRLWLESGNNPFKFFKRFSSFARPQLKLLLAESYEGCRDADAVLCSTIGLFPAICIREKLGIPIFPAFLQPVTPTNEFPNYLFPQDTGRGKIYNSLSYIIADNVFWQLFRKGYNEARMEVLNLKPISFIGPIRKLRKMNIPAIYGFSPMLVPKPHDWKPNHHITGFWLNENESDWEPSSELADFLNGGPKPVYIGFGSMTLRDPDELTAIAVQALQITGQRGILLEGWGRLGKTELPDFVFKTDSIPHDWLFKKVAAVVHHGGSGTTATGLRAGCPTIITPFFADQPFWGWRVYKAGLGPKPIPINKLTAENLAEAINEALNNENIKFNSQKAGRIIKEENGVEKAVELLNGFFKEVY